MFTRVEALSYRCLRYVDQRLTPFQVLIGPNASGKSALLDVIAFLSDLVREKEGVAAAVAARVPDVRDLCWMRRSDAFELAVEAAIPRALHTQRNGAYSHVRYEVRIGLHPETQELGILAEALWLKGEAPNADRSRNGQKALFPEEVKPPQSIVTGPHQWAPAGRRRVLNKVAESGNDYFRAETSAWNNLFRLGPRRSALANLPEDEEKFPVSIWFRRSLLEGVQRLALNSEALRRPSRPGVPRRFIPDGSNLPWVVQDLHERAPQRLREWIAHVRTALPDLRNIRTVERPEDRHRYLVLDYDTGLEAPSWLVSDGTLRLLALTILAYLPDLEGVYLIEEPENGIHPRAVETVLQSLSSVYGAQVLLATHSPVILSLAQPHQVLCFARTLQGATDIVVGSEHPRLREWRGETDLGTLFASGVLG
ncbi:MAG: AAA family ATPase [Caldilineales bacterium]|nr:AAA family ATPase [Caldilineales bacterium]MDW8319120.1 AAA family ATPase [Anaerolineae bacterium]